MESSWGKLTEAKEIGGILQLCMSSGAKTESHNRAGSKYQELWRQNMTQMQRNVDPTLILCRLREKMHHIRLASFAEFLRMIIDSNLTITAI